MPDVKLVKLRIDAFQNAAFSEKAAEPSTYSLQINPDTYRHQHSTAYKHEPSTDTAGNPVKFLSMQPQTVSFEFYMDATGVIPGVKNLRAEIDKFKQVVYEYHGDQHQPNYLLLTWAGGTFQCRLTALDIEYTLFAPSGSPLRAKLTVAFQEYVSPEELEKRSRKNSPDLSHLREVRPGDTLPLMCHRIYGDSRWYPEVAAHNGLQDFRMLVPGSRIIFPPLARA